LRNYWIDIFGRGGGVLVEKPLHQNQFAYRAGTSTETALFQVTHTLENSLNHKEIASGAFIDIDGAFDITSFHAITMAARERGVEETSCRWISSMLESRVTHTSVTVCTLTAKVVVGCPQGGVISPLLWNLVTHRILTITNDLGFNTWICGRHRHHNPWQICTYRQGDYASGPERGSKMGSQGGSEN
jgi:hypothetical protein